VPDAPAAPSVVPIGGVVPEPMFRSANERDEQGRPVVSQSSGFLAQASGVPSLLEFGRHVFNQVNPIAAVQTVASAFPKILGGSVGPIDTVKALGKAQGALYDRAKAEYDRGNYGMAAVHFVNYLTPILGPAVDKAGDELQAGKWAAGGGDAVGIGLAMFAPQRLAELAAARRAAPVMGAPARGGLNPAEAASNAFAESRGVPLDAATATGSRTLRAAQKRVANSMGGEGTASDLIARQQDALTRVGGELADQARPGVVTPEQAGESVRGTITQVMRSLHDKANLAYDRVRDIEGRISGQVPKTEDSSVVAARQARQKASLAGATLTDAEINELRNIRDELEAQPYQSGKLVQDEAGVSSGTTYTRRVGNANVYRDIGQASGSNESGARMVKSIDASLESGHFTSLSRGALDVARKRLAGDLTVSKGWQKPGTRGAAAPELTQEMALPVDLRLAKETLTPVYERLKREGALAPLMGGKAEALRALDRLITGPDHAPVSTADAVLSDLKAMSRSDVLELRGPGKGAAAYAAKQVDGAINMALEAQAPDAKLALERGRAATRGKYQAGDVLETLRQEPVQAFRQLTAPGDSGIRLLRRVKAIAPDQMADVARAWLHQALELAGQEGGFGHSARLWADWQRLGPETKRLLFPAQGQAEALNHFFLLAKRLAENPNPSGTAHNLTVFNVGGTVASWPLAKLLYTPRGVSALRRVLSPVPKTPATGAVATAGARAAQAAALADLVAAAKAEGVALPLAAESEPRR